MKRLAPLAILFALGVAAGFLWHQWWPSAPPGSSAAGDSKDSALDPGKPRAQALYVCPMHPEISRATPGTCPICGMDLVAKSPAAEEDSQGHDHDHGHAGPVYVCPMHPEVIAAQPGRCPICGMDLVPKATKGEGAEAPMASAAPVAVAPGIVNQLGVRTAKVQRGRLDRRLDAFGAYFEVTAQGFRGNVQSTDAGAKNLVLAQVFEAEAPLVRVGQGAEVRFTGRGPRIWKGRVESVDPQVNQGTHTLQFRVAVEVEPGTVIPGTSARVRLAVDPVEDVLLVPRDAVIASARADRVVVALGGGRFEPREVVAEDLGEAQVIIRSGLSGGEEVVVSGQFLLDSEASLQAGLRRLGEAGTAEDASGEAR